MGVEWYGVTYDVRPMTTGAVVSFLVELATRFVDEPDEAVVEDIVEWLSTHTSATSLEVVEVATKAAAEGVTILGLALDVVEASVSPRRARIVDALKIREGMPRDWRPTAGTGCECARCSGLSDDASDCRYAEAGVGIVDRMVAGIDVELAARLWDRPYSLYDLAREQSHARALGFEYRRLTPDDSPASISPRADRHRAVAARMRSRYHRG